MPFTTSCKKKYNVKESKRSKKCWKSSFLDSRKSKSANSVRTTVVSGSSRWIITFIVHLLNPKKSTFYSKAWLNSKNPVSHNKLWKKTFFSTPAWSSETKILNSKKEPEMQSHAQLMSKFLPYPKCNIHLNLGPSLTMLPKPFLKLSLMKKNPLLLAYPNSIKASVSVTVSKFHPKKAFYLSLGVITSIKAVWTHKTKRAKVNKKDNMTWSETRTFFWTWIQRRKKNLIWENFPQKPKKKQKNYSKIKSLNSSNSNSKVDSAWITLFWIFDF